MFKNTFVFIKYNYRPIKYGLIFKKITFKMYTHTATIVSFIIKFTFVLKMFFIIVL